MTPADQPNHAGKGADREAERTTVLAAGEDALAEPAAPDGGSGGSGGSAERSPGEGNGSAETMRTGGDLAGDLELSHPAVPPPWQRVNAESAYARPSEPRAVDEPTMDSVENSTDQLLRPPGIPVPPVDRSVVTGTAADRLYGDTTPPGGFAAPIGTPGTSGVGSAPSRTTVHLENASATTGTIRPTAAPSALRRPGRGPRRANLQIKRFDPWSVLKLSLVLGVALFFVWLVAVGALYAVLDGMGVWDKVNGISTDLLQRSDANSEPLISAGRVFGIAAIVGAVNIVLFSALATVGAFVYNVSADLAGGLEVTLAERE